MSAITTCGGAIEIAAPGDQLIAKSISSFAVTFGKMFAKSAPSVLKSIVALPRRSAPPEMLIRKIVSGDEDTSSGTVRMPSWFTPLAVGS